MKFKSFLPPLIACCALAIAHNVSALSIDDANYLGSYTPPQPSGDADEEMNVQHLVDLFNGDTTDLVFNGRTFLPPGSGGGNIPNPAPDATYLDRDETSGNTSVDVTGVEYILAKYMDAISHVWYVGDQSGTVTVPGSDVQQGISHITRFTGTGVPDGGATLAMLGLGIVGMAMARRPKA